MWWGAFNNAFGREECVEEYVVADVAREQMAADPTLAAEFENKMESDPAVAKSQHVRREFRARRH